MIQNRLLVKTSLILVVLAYAEAQLYQQQHLRRSQNLPQQAEVIVNNVAPTPSASGKIKFGDKKPKIATTLASPTSASTFSSRQYPSPNWTNFRPEDSIAPRPLHRSEVYHQQSLPHVMQYEIPIKQKDRQIATYKGQQRAREPTYLPTSSSEELYQQQEQQRANFSKSHESSRQRQRASSNWSGRGRSRSKEINANNSSQLNHTNDAAGRKSLKQYNSSVAHKSTGPLNVDGNRPPLTKSSYSSTTTTKATTTTTKTTTTTPRPLLFPNFNSRFNIFSPEFWGFSNPNTTPAPVTTTTTKRPPKKYTPPPPTQRPFANEEKNNFQKSKPQFRLKSTATPTTSSTTTTTSTTTSKKDLASDGPFRIALPTFNFFNTDSQRPQSPEKEKEKRAIIASLRERFNCPRESEVRFQLFPKICKSDEDCSVWNREELCCDIFGSKSCVSGVPKPLEESSHAPILGLIQRKCPTRPLAELWWEVKECQTDMDCWPRVCCPDGRRRYCRTSQPELDTAPVPVKRSFDYLSEYLECTPPPPPIFDLHPKACTSTLDCFPNVCCQEAGLRHCRPPKKSVLTLMANFLNVDLVKRFTQNIVIK